MSPTQQEELNTRPESSQSQHAEPCSDSTCRRAVLPGRYGCADHAYFYDKLRSFEAGRMSQAMGEY